MPAKDPSTPKLRIDKWLWYARVVKSRSLAQKLVASGAVRVDGQKITGPDYRLTPDMVLTISLHERIRIFRVLALGERRGPASEAATLYEDLSPQMPKKERNPFTLTPALREPGAGRPTKKERRETDRFRSGD